MHGTIKPVEGHHAAPAQHPAMWCDTGCQQQYRLQKRLPKDQEDDCASVHSPSHLTHGLPIPIPKMQGLMQGLFNAF